MRQPVQVNLDTIDTSLETISNELIHYYSQLANKILYLPCDDPDSSEYWNYFTSHFLDIGLKKILCTHYNPGNACITEYDKDICLVQQLKDNGDFRSEECVNLISQADIIITTPPLSMFRELLNIVLTLRKDFLIIGPVSEAASPDIFPLIQNGIIRLGVNSGTLQFKHIINQRPGALFIEGEIEVLDVEGLCWFTNLRHYKMFQLLKLTAKYKGNEKKYPKYDDYDAIEISDISKIPKDYKDVMGVPIDILTQYCPDQFDLIDCREVTLHKEKLQRVLIKKRLIL